MCRRWRRSALTAVLLAVCLGHLFLGVSVKVEESFNAQLMHDLLFDGGRVFLTSQEEINTTPQWVRQGIASYDHHLFPGVVPRTTLGALSVAAVAQPLLRLWYMIPKPWLISYDHGDRVEALALCRVILALASAASLTHMAFGLDVACRRDRRHREGKVSTWMVLLLCFSMFHVVYYASRPLPNTFACVLVNGAIGQLYRGYHERAFTLLAFATATFRSDTLVFMAPLAFAVLATHGWRPTIRAGTAAVAGFGLGGALSVSADSVFWSRWVWPEAEVFFFNTISNRSHEWGVLPWHWYWSSALPRGLLAAAPLTVVALTMSCTKRLVLPPIVRAVSMAALGFIALYSFLPHKELRFVLMGLPALAAPVAFLLNDAWSRKGIVIRGLIVALLVLCGGVTVVFGMANASQFTGTRALAAVHRDVLQVYPKLELEDAPWRLRVYLDAYACMNGITRFSKLVPNRSSIVVTYSKDPTVFNRTAFADGSPLPACGEGEPSYFEYLIVRHKDTQWHLDRCAESSVPLKVLTTIRTVVPSWQRALRGKRPFQYGDPFLSVLKAGFL